MYCKLNWRQDILSCLDTVSNLQFATVQSEIYWGLLKTVLTCLQVSSHRRHGQNKTLFVLSMSAM